MRRRTALAAGLGLVASLTGCLGGDGAAASPPDAATATPTRRDRRTPTRTAEGTPTDSPTPAEDDATATPTPRGTYDISLRYGYYPDEETLWVHHNGGDWLYADRGEALRAVGPEGSWTVFDPDGKFLTFPVGANQRGPAVPPETSLELVVTVGGTDHPVGSVETPTAKRDIRTPPDRFPLYDPFEYAVADDGSSLTVTDDYGLDVSADRLAVHVEGRRTAWTDPDGTVTEGDATTVPLRSADRFVKATWRDGADWVHSLGGYIIE